MLEDSQVIDYLAKLEVASATSPTKEQLDELILAHQLKVPFSTVHLHRSQKTPELSTDALYKKIVVDGRGGYCFELNKLFQELLEALGYSVRPVLCRAVRGRELRMPINHRGMIVRIDGADLFADVGFGGPIPAGSLLLEDGLKQDIFGETYTPFFGDDGWWKVERVTRAGFDAYDDNFPVRKQIEFEICESIVEDIDFDALNVAFSQPSVLFCDHEIVNLRMPNGYRGYKDGVLTLKEDGSKEVTELSTRQEQNQILLKYFGIK